MENLDTHLPPFLSINLFTRENFLKHSTERLLYEMLRKCETKQFWWNIVITATFFILYSFPYQKFSETQKGFLYKNFRHFETKIFRRKFLILPLPPSLSINFFTSEKVLKHSTEWLLYEMLRSCETKQFRWKIVILTPSLIVYSFRYQKFSETQKVSSTKVFGTLRQKFFDGKSWYSRSPFLIHKLFHKRKSSETQHRMVALRNVTELWDNTI